ncbi:FCD domain-containing protein [Streptomyces sp. ST2-7A]|uniref:FadR/GntR family transcriptional regulator n=1 Tax=Streptomyces sp. ST2-7A TaxID=2907214 RepID=UPI0027E36935|nr:FCD domain-containing protein [Streptomyces sp. ST2-7A]
MALTDEAIDRVKRMILAGELAPGQRLPREDVLAEQLGLSRSSLREAVRALTAMRILVARQGDGTYVSGLEPHLLLESLTFAADVSTGEAVRQLLQVRRMLEPPATALAAPLIDDTTLAELRVVLDREAAARDAEEFVAHDMEFHRRIVAVVGNPVLEVLLRSLSGATQRVRVLHGTGDRAVRERAHREHEAIWEALAAGDAALAEATARVHVAGVEHRLAAPTGWVPPNGRARGAGARSRIGERTGPPDGRMGEGRGHPGDPGAK